MVVALGGKVTKTVSERTTVAALKQGSYSEMSERSKFVTASMRGSTVVHFDGFRDEVMKLASNPHVHIEDVQDLWRVHAVKFTDYSAQEREREN